MSKLEMIERELRALGFDFLGTGVGKDQFEGMVSNLYRRSLLARTPQTIQVVIGDNNDYETMLFSTNIPLVTRQHFLDKIKSYDDSVSKLNPVDTLEGFAGPSS